MKTILSILLLLFTGIAVAQDSYSNAGIIHAAIIEEGRIINQMNPALPTDMPIGLSKSMGGQDYLVGIDSIVLNSEGSSYISASSMVEVPATGDLLAFSGSKISITPNGIKGASVARLNLAVDIPIRINNNLKLTLKGSEKKTFVEFDCNGFTGMGVQGTFEFCRDFLIPVNPDGNIAPEPARVRADFETQMSDFSNMLAKVSISPFQVPELAGFDFYVQDAWVDQSDVANPLGLIFPKDYTNPDITGNTNLWRGFYLKQLSVKLPKQFETGKSNQRKELMVSNALIDPTGFSGWITGKGVIPMDEGSVGDWPFSVDEISVQLTCNKLTGAGFRGALVVPISKKDQKLDYTAVIQSGNNYLISVKNRDSLEVPMWGALMKLYPSSSVTLAYQNEKFVPTAVLHGEVSVNPDAGGGNKSKFKGIIFENLTLTSVKPYFVNGVFSIVSENSDMSGFSITLKEIGLVRREAENMIGLHFGVDVHMMKDDEGGFSGQGALTVFGKYPEGGSVRDGFKFDHVELNRLVLDVSSEAYTIHGELDIYKKDEVYGNGFRGFVNATFQPGIAVRATAQFGNVKGMRYWYVDALVMLPSGIPCGPGFGLYGFGGGLYHHMRRADMNNPKLDNAPVASNSELPASGQTKAQLVDLQPPPSGTKYVPDEKTFLGLKATVVAGTFPSAQAFNLDATFEIAFTDKCGVRYIAFDGKGYFMTELTQRNNPPIMANVGISMDFENQVLHGNFDVYINVNNTIRGIHPKNLAGGAVMHFEKGSWYINIGTPDNRLGLNFMGMFTATSYFMVGTNIPGMPPPPENVSGILGGADLNFMRDENALGKGNGFCFGASFDANTGKKQFLIFYGQFGAGAGFDIMLKNYGKNVQCVNSGKLGINGWYASGQSYAYLQGELGIHVDLLFTKGDYKILDIGAAAVLQAKLPNPTFLKGTVGGYYNILNGMVKGNCKYELTIGEQCQMTGGGSIVEGIKVISELTPKTGDGNINVFNNPQAAFNLAIDKSFDMEDMDGRVKTFRAIVKEFKVYKGTSEIAGSVEWNEANDVASFKPFDILPGKASLKTIVKAGFEEKINGVWQQVLVNNKAVEEVLEASFTTGDAPDDIPLSNVKYSYPSINQYNFLKSEYGQGYIQLHQGQDELFEQDVQWIKKLRFVKAGEPTGVTTDFQYNTDGNTVLFSIPQTLENGKIYSLQLVNLPASQAMKVDANVKSNVKALSSDVDGAMASMSSKSIEGTRDVLEEKVFYQAGLKTSKYNTFSEKMKTLSISEPWTYPIYNYRGLDEMGVNISGDETFDKYEISGNASISKLIDGQAGTNNSWYSRDIYPLLYEQYPLNGTGFITWRNTEDLGLPPLKAIEIRQSSADKILTENEMNSGVAEGTPAYAQVIYNLPFYMYKDYAELQQKAAILMTQNISSKKIHNLIYTPFPQLTQGKYDVTLNYTLPGLKKVSSSYKLQFRYY